MKEQIILVAQSNFRNRLFFHETIQRLFSDCEKVEFIIPFRSSIWYMMDDNKMKGYTYNADFFKLNDELAFMSPTYKTFYSSKEKVKELLRLEFTLKKRACKIVLFSDGNDEEINNLEQLAISEKLEIIKIPIIIEDLTSSFNEILMLDISLLKTSEDISKEIQHHNDKYNLACNNSYWEIAAILRDRLITLNEMV